MKLLLTSGGISNPSIETALVDMLGGNIRLALDVMLFFNRRYGI